jgi:NitT/TauT family transport system permease protein
VNVSVAAQRAALGRRGHPSPGARVPAIPGRALEVASLVGGLVLWELAGRLLALPWLPPFSACIGALVELTMRGFIIPDLIDSVQALAVGFAISFGLALIVAFLMAEFEVVELAIGPYVYALFLLPSIALVPVFLAIWGVDPLSRVAVIVTYTVFYMILNFHTAFTQRDPALEEMAASFRASRWQRIRFLTIPMALPLVMATIRLGLSRAVKGMINGEQFIATFGLGALVSQFGGQFAADKVFAVILVIVALAFVLDIVTRVLDSRWTHWAAR